MKRIPVAALRESDVQKSVVAFLRRVGCGVYVLSQGRKTRQTPGLPDLFAFPLVGNAFAFESKTVSGKQSPEQEAFEAHCQRCGLDYVKGGIREAVDYWNARQERAA